MKTIKEIIDNYEGIGYVATVEKNMKPKKLALDKKIKTQQNKRKTP